MFGRPPRNLSYGPDLELLLNSQKIGNMGLLNTEN